MLNLHNVANKNFAKLLAQVLKLADSASEIQTFDTKDLEKCLGAPGRIVIGSSMIRDTGRKDLGSAVFTNCVAASSCPPPGGDAATGALLLLLNSKTASDPKISKNLEDPSKIEGMINMLDERKKEPIDFRRTGVITLFTGVGLFLFGVFFLGSVLKGVGALVAAIGLGQLIAGYLYPNTSEELTNAV